MVPWPRRRPHDAPAEDCTCGVYAGDLPTGLGALDPYARLGWHVRHRVVGEVNLWGRVVECSKGWRGQYAYPSRLIVPARRLHDVPVPRLDDIVDALRCYGVPVTVAVAGTRRDLAAVINAG
jgi:hypothetical protein